MGDTSFDWIPKEGMEFNTVDDAWAFWVTYGWKMGFNVRKHYENKCKKSGEVTSKRFVCSNEGIRVKDKRHEVTKNPRKETRTNCHARMGIKLIRETGKYCVYDFVAEHNHVLQLLDCCHMMPSKRKMTDAQAFKADLGDDCDPKATEECMDRQASGREDLRIYLRTKRKRDLEYGESGILLRYFQNKSVEDPSFYHAVQLDSCERITNIFWADVRMLMDYALFGDVVTLVTTYSIKKEYRPLGVFAGFNHHRGVVIFGAAFLYDETLDSFAWLFQQFLEANKQMKPKTIFTDHNAEMAEALNKVMPETRHGLCSWHLIQNGKKHHGSLMKDGSCFLGDLMKLMYGYEDESNFEEVWCVMLSSYSLEDSAWMKGIYKVKEKWAKCYMKTAFTIGMRSTQLSESLNGDLKDYLKPTIDVLQFFKHFERVVNEKRYKELQVEYHAREHLPRMRVKTSPLLKQVAQAYTPLIFELFQEEWEKTFETYIKHRYETDTLREYLVAIVDKEGEYKVMVHVAGQSLSCSCRKFDYLGILCCHALKVLDIMDIKLIPERYLLKRWLREARVESIQEKSECDVQRSNNLDVTDRYRDLCPDLVKLAARACDYAEGYLLVKKACVELNKQLYDIRRKRCNYIEGSSSKFVNLNESTDHRNLNE